MIRATIYYDESQKYPEPPLDLILRKFSRLGSSDLSGNDTKSRVNVVRRETKSLSSGELEEVIEEIRRIKPQCRGSVVASGGKMLPLSGSKKLNLQNTPVIIVREDAVPVYVFPCKIGEKYYSVMEGIDFLKQNLPSIVELRGEMEDSLAKRLSATPEQLEEGLVFDSSELDTSTGKTDLVFRDRHGKYLIIEVEREATDSAVGQILRLSAGFERDHKLLPESVRCGIVSYRANSNILAASSRARIEVWVFDTKGRKFLKRN